MTRTALDATIADSHVVVVAGSGGVGKTTLSAALAVRAAVEGRRVAVVTIDPAKRLADALGLAGDSAVGNDPVRIPLDDARGELWALMLDTRSTFDALVDRYSPNAEQAQRIRSNLFYKNISGALSGTQEYMAAEKLYELKGMTDSISSSSTLRPHARRSTFSAHRPACAASSTILSIASSSLRRRSACVR